MIRAALLPLFCLCVSQTCPAQTGIDFEKAVLPILERECMECHKAPYTQNGRLKKPKGDLRLDGKAFLLQGGEGGKVLTPGQSAQSELYTRTILPADHDDIMPPKDGPLSIGDRLVLKQWINEGAKFGSWVGAKPVRVSKPASGSKPTSASIRPANRSAAAGPDYAALAAGLPMLSAKQLERIRTASGLSIVALAKGSPLLRVDTATEATAVTNQKLLHLQPLGKHVTHLSLGNTALTDLDVLAAFPRLVGLDLHGTPVKDAQLATLSSLNSLQWLNLHSTSIGDAALPHLAKLSGLQFLYLWNTRVSPAGIQGLRASLPETKVVAGNQLP